MATQNPTASGSARRDMTTKTLTTGKIMLYGLAAIVAAVIANLVVRAILTPLLGLSPDFLPFQLPRIILFTVGGTFLGLLVFLLVYRLSSNPTRTFTIVAVVAFFVSILPNLGLMANPAAAPFPGEAFVGVLTALVKR
jgi:uncharacterized protein YacL